MTILIRFLKNKPANNYQSAVLGYFGLHDKLSSGEKNLQIYLKVIQTMCFRPAHILFLPRDATQSAVMPQYVVCPSVSLSVRL